MNAWVTVAVLTAAVLAAPTPAAATDTAVRGTVSSHFTGSSTLHDFSGSAPPSGFVLQPDSDGSWAAAVEIRVNTLTTENGTRDRKMREMFHSEEHPSLRAEFTHMVPEEVRTTGRLPFRLTIAGTTRDVISKVRDWRQTDDQVDFVAEFDVSLSAFSLKAPRAFVVVVADSVHVTTEVSLRRE